MILKIDETNNTKIRVTFSAIGRVLAHELVHLIHEDHSRAFWATLGRIMPDYEDRKVRLRAMGPRLVW